MNVDKNLTINKSEKASTIDIDVINSDVKFYGFNYINEEHRYARLAIKDEKIINFVSPKVVALSKNTSGGQVHFLTNTDKLIIKANVSNAAGLSGMTFVGQIGFDCYVGKSYDDLLFYNTARFEIGKTEYEFTLFENENHEEKLVVINFPLYGGVNKLTLSINENAYIKKPLQNLTNNNKIVIYGTSITQGGCASRPGLSYTNILSRRLKCEFINMGFSGNAFGEIEVAKVISEIKDVTMFIVDYEANGGTNGKMELTLEDFVKEIRSKNPKTPIVLISRIKYLFDDLKENLGKRREELRLFQENLVKYFNNSGDTDVYYIDGSKLLGDNYHEYTIDSIHPNDIGFMKIADNLEPQLKEILNKYNK